MGSDFVAGKKEKFPEWAHQLFSEILKENVSRQKGLNWHNNRKKKKRVPDTKYCMSMERFGWGGYRRCFGDSVAIAFWFQTLWYISMFPPMKTDQGWVIDHYYVTSCHRPLWMVLLCFLFIKTRELDRFHWSISHNTLSKQTQLPQTYPKTEIF